MPVQAFRAIMYLYELLGCRYPNQANEVFLVKVSSRRAPAVAQQCVSLPYYMSLEFCPTLLYALSLVRISACEAVVVAQQRVCFLYYTSLELLLGRHPEPVPMSVYSPPYLFA